MEVIILEIRNLKICFETVWTIYVTSVKPVRRENCRYSGHIDFIFFFFCLDGINPIC